MTPQPALNRLRAAVPSSVNLIDSITRLDTAARALPLTPFREPVAIIELSDKGNNELINLDVAYLSAWCNHIAYSMRVRMRTLEPGIIGDLANGKYLSSQVLLRSHLEAAAVASLCLEAVRATAADGNLIRLGALIPRTLFGTALYSKAKRNDLANSMLTYSEQRTILISDAIRALEKFAYGPTAEEGILGVAYSLLCEAAHPNHRGTKGYVTVEHLDPNAEFGWKVLYSETEAVSSILTERLLELLLVSMRHGYAASEMLRRMRFSEDDGSITFHMVDVTHAQAVWTDLLQRDTEPEGKEADYGRDR